MLIPKGISNATRDLKSLHFDSTLSSLDLLCIFKSLNLLDLNNLNVRSSDNWICSVLTVESAVS